MLAIFNGQAFQLNFLIAYAPTSETSTQDSESFYETLTETYNKYKYRGPTLMLGDFNVSILQPEDDESNLIGKYLLDNTSEGPTHLPPKQDEIRTIFIQTCK